MTQRYRVCVTASCQYGFVAWQRTGTVTPAPRSVPHAGRHAHTASFILCIFVPSSLDLWILAGGPPIPTHIRSVAAQPGSTHVQSIPIAGLPQLYWASCRRCPTPCTGFDGGYSLHSPILLRADDPCLRTPGQAVPPSDSDSLRCRLHRLRFRNIFGLIFFSAAVCRPLADV